MVFLLESEKYGQSQAVLYAGREVVVELWLRSGRGGLTGPFPD